VDTLSSLRESAEWDKKHGDAVVLHPDIMLALIECAHIVQTDYLLLSADQQIKAAQALKELGV
jgi:hypothetical protein